MTSEEVSGVFSDSLGAVPRDSIVSIVAKRLLENLTSGRVQPGTRLPSERQLAESLQVGRSAVREALAALDLLGIVDIRPGSGTYLRGSSSDLLPRTIDWGLMLGVQRIQDVVEVRQHLEVVSAQLAAERASDDEIETIGKRLADMRRAVSNVADYVDADVAFHLEIANAAKNSVLSGLLHSVRELLYVWVQRTSHDPKSAKASVAEHAAVFEAIQRRDVKGAQQAMQKHMAIASERLRSSLATDNT